VQCDRRNAETAEVKTTVAVQMGWPMNISRNKHMFNIHTKKIINQKKLKYLDRNMKM